jgi:hypothetical protein
MAFTYITLTGGNGYRYATGDTPSRVHVRARPLVEMTNGTKTIKAEVRIPIAANGDATEDLAATDDPGTTPTGNAYRFQIEVDGRIVRSFLAELPYDAASGEIDIDDLVEVDAPPNLTASYDLVVVTAAEYAALGSPDAHTLYAVIS